MNQNIDLLTQICHIININPDDFKFYANNNHYVIVTSENKNHLIKKDKKGNLIKNSYCTY